jgi:putative CocE/NonD family hydrolase
MRTDVVYPDRADEDEKLLTYTSAPMETDVEITGNPVITLYVASTETDGAFHVYLEDVAPDDRVTYITEGIMRTIHRAESGARPEPHHTFERADAAPMVPGEVTEIRFNLYATSVLIEKGHRIRIAIAGHDASVFARYPAAGTPVLTVQRNSVCPSHVELPMKVR